MEPPYEQMTLLTWGGVLGPSPGSWLPANPLTTLTSIDASGNVSSRMGANLHHARWYSSGVLLPDGQVLAVGGADKDDVIVPGLAIPVRIPELYNPATGEWSEVAAHTRDRAYHNSALLLPDMRVLLGGNAPLAAHYGGPNRDQGGPFANNDNDSSFEVWSPPYLFRGPRPSIKRVQKGVGYRETFNITTPDAGLVESVLLMRIPSPEHVNDSDQRSLKLEFTRSGPSTRDRHRAAVGQRGASRHLLPGGEQEEPAGPDPVGGPHGGRRPHRPVRRPPAVPRRRSAADRRLGHPRPRTPATSPRRRAGECSSGSRASWPGGASPFSCSCWPLPGLPASPASGHGGADPAEPIFEHMAPTVPGIKVEVVYSVNYQFLVTNASGQTITILADSGEPFLRIGPDGVQGNFASPAFYDTNSPEGRTELPGAGQAGPRRDADLAQDRPRTQLGVVRPPAPPRRPHHPPGDPEGQQGGGPRPVDGPHPGRRPARESCRAASSTAPRPGPTPWSRSRR